MKKKTTKKAQFGMNIDPEFLEQLKRSGYGKSLSEGALGGASMSSILPTVLPNTDLSKPIDLTDTSVSAPKRGPQMLPDHLLPTSPNVPKLQAAQMPQVQPLGSRAEEAQKEGGPKGSKLVKAITGTIGDVTQFMFKSIPALTAMLPEDNRNNIRPYQPYAYNPYPNGTGADVLYEKGGSVRPADKTKPIGYKPPKGKPRKLSKKEEKELELERMREAQQNQQRLQEVEGAVNGIESRRAQEEDSFNRNFNSAWNAVKMLDPTGVSSYPDLANALEAGDYPQALLQGVQSLPLIGRGAQVGRLGRSGPALRTLQQTMNIGEPIMDVAEYDPERTPYPITGDTFQSGGKARSGYHTVTRKQGIMTTTEEVPDWMLPPQEQKPTPVDNDVISTADFQPPAPRSLPPPERIVPKNSVSYEQLNFAGKDVYSPQFHGDWTRRDMDAWWGSSPSEMNGLPILRGDQWQGVNQGYVSPPRGPIGWHNQPQPKAFRPELDMWGNAKHNLLPLMENGGSIQPGQELDLTEEEIKALMEQGYEFDFE